MQGGVPVVEGDRERPFFAAVPLWPPCCGVLRFGPHAHEGQRGLTDCAARAALPRIVAHLEVQHSAADMLGVCMLAMHLDFTLQPHNNLQTMRTLSKTVEQSEG